MNKKQLAEAISEGIENGFWRPLGQIIITLAIIFLLIVLSAVIYEKYQDYKWEQEHCQDGICTVTVVGVSMAAPCDDYKIECYLYYDSGHFFTARPLCGYGEANEWHQYIENKEGKEFRMECS